MQVGTLDPQSPKLDWMTLICHDDYQASTLSLHIIPSRHHQLHKPSSQVHTPLSRPNTAVPTAIMTSYLPNLAHDNLSFYTIPLAFVVALAPRVFIANASKAATNKPASDKAKSPPSSSDQTVSDDSAVDSKTKARISRAGAAMNNSLQNLGIFAAAVTAGNAAGVGAGRMNALSMGYVGVRFAYNHIYIFQDLLPPVTRTAAYMTGVMLCMAMFVQAGMTMNARTLL